MFGTAALFWSAWRRHRVLRRSLAGGLFAFQLLIAGVYGTTVRETIYMMFSGAHPPRLVRVIGGSADIFTPEGWLGLGYAHPLTLVMLIAWTVAVAGAAVAGEVEDGTAEFLVSRPVDRSVVLLACVLAWGAGLLVVLAAAYLGTLAGTCLVDELSGFDPVTGLGLPMAVVPVQLAIAGVAFLASAASSSRARSNAVGIAFAVVSYFLNLAAVLWEPLQPLAPLSVFHYLDPGGWVQHGAAWGGAAVPALSGAALLVLANAALSRRDIAR